MFGKEDQASHCKTLFNASSLENMSLINTHLSRQKAAALKEANSLSNTRAVWRICVKREHTNRHRGMWWFVGFARIMANSCSLNQDTGFLGWVQFFFLISRPNYKDLPCLFNSPIVRLGQWDKQLSNCICDTKHDVQRGSCKTHMLICLRMTISGIIYIIRSFCVNVPTVITVVLRGK